MKWLKRLQILIKQIYNLNYMNLEHITSENLNNQFDLYAILKDSVFYPASGTDGTPIEAFSAITNSFVYVDYTLKKRAISNALKNDFKNIGYRLIGIKELSHSDLTPREFADYEYNPDEKELFRLSEKSIRNLYQKAIKNSFGFWAVYELMPNASKPETKNKRMSILHIYGEAIHFFIKSYWYHKLNPLAIAFICPGEGYGDNWTIFRNKDYKLYQTLHLNNKLNGQNMPKYILEFRNDKNCCFGEEYVYHYSVHSYTHNKPIYLFKYNTDQ
jgi:hypothetical protein